MAKSRIGSNTVAADRPPESRADKFRRLANRRVNAALTAIAAVESLSNCRSYDYTEDQVREIASVLRAAVVAVSTAFERGGAAATLFTL